ncbi:MAG: HlyD family efflux transporter periplasmic adaptor subunit [Firmicutes bacterium]|nr:HlyD family efflux transporter periplasmic adaptor subunit [Bacillota bacterium]
MRKIKFTQQEVKQPKGNSMPPLIEGEAQAATAEEAAAAAAPREKPRKGRALTVVCVVLLVLFTLTLCLDVANALTFTAAAGGTDALPGSGTMDTIDSSDMQMPDADSYFSDMEMPDMDADSYDAGFSFDGGMEGMEGGRGEISGSDAGDADLTDAAAADTGVLYTLRAALRRAFWPVLIVCVLGDIVCAAILWIHRRIRLRARAEAMAELAGEEAEEEILPRRRRRLWIPAVALLAVIALVLQLLPLWNSETSSITVVTQTLSSTAALSSIDTVLSGAGTLAEEDAASITLPSSVTVECYYVSNGDTVSAGDLLATVSRTSVGVAIVELQEALDALDESIAEAAEEEVSTSVAATTAGRVKAIYAEEGVAVADTIGEYGALMLVSVDGLMAVEVSASDALYIGDAVTVTLSDGTEQTGHVSSQLDGTAVITLSDETTALGDTVTVTDADGNTLGTGTLYIHSELRVLSYYGTVESIEVELDEEIEVGDTLLELTDVGDSATYTSLLEQRAELEEEMATLCRLYLDGSLYADCDGVVSGISDDATVVSTASAAVASATAATSDSGYTLVLLANYEQDDSPEEETEAEEDEETEETTPGESEPEEDEQTGEDEETEETTPAPDGESGDSGSEADYTAQQLAALIPSITGLGVLQGLSDLDLESQIRYMSGAIRYVAVDAQELDVNTPGTYTVTYILLVNQSVLAATLGVSSAESGYGILTFTVPVTVVSEQEAEAWQLANPTLVWIGEGSGTGDTDSSEDTGAMEGNTGSNGSSASGAQDSAASAGADSGSSASSYTVSEQTLLSVTPQEYMTVTISVDELDILSLTEGQSALVTLSALTGRSFTGTVTSIATSGTNSGGSTKFEVEILLERTEQMLVGMNAAVQITLATASDVLTIPEAALVEEGSTTYVYTGYNESSDTLCDPVAVETGVSDGTSVEILSGLSEGDVVYYSYADSYTYTFVS